MIIVLLAGIGYFSYHKWVKHSNIDSWNFIPADASIVLELGLLKDYNLVSGYPVMANLGETSVVSSIEEGISFLDTLNGKGGFSAVFKNAPTLISMHQTSSEDFDFLYVVDLENIAQNTFAEASVNKVKKMGYRVKTRNYNGFEISEISKDSKIFTFIFYKNFALASFTPYLVEDAIRALSGDQNPFKGKFINIDDTSQEPSLLKLYVNYEALSTAFSSISLEDTSLPFESGDYSLSMDSNFFSLSGFSYATDTWISTHSQQGATFDMAQVIPENTAYMYHISGIDLKDWKVKHLDYLRANYPDIKSLQDSLKQNYDFDVAQVFDLVDEEIGVVKVEAGSSKDHRMLFILEVQDTKKSLDFIQGLTERVVRSQGDSVYSESYSDNEIRYLPIKDFPSALLGNLASDFSQCFYVNHRNYLIFSNNLQELKAAVYGIQNENTWGKSLRANEFLLRTNNTANVSLFINIPRAISTVQDDLKAGWKNHLSENLSTYQNFEYAAFQFSHIDNKYFTNFTFSQPIKKSNEKPKSAPDSDLRFAYDLITKPHLVRTHAYKGFDMIVQDSIYTLYYLNASQKTLWTKKIEGKIISDIYSIDYYNNGKIQYAFATKNKIHLLDRNGTPIPGYPKGLDGTSIDHFSIIDYNLSKNYRFAITDIDGNVYLMDKELNKLEGWDPKEYMRAAIQPLRHQRLGRRDIMISIQQDGIINVTNRRAETVEGFPFETKEKLNGDYFIKASNGLNNSSLTLVAKSGILLELNMNGEVLQRTQLLRTSADTKFSLVTGKNNKSFLIVRNNENKYEILDDTGNLLFEKDYLTEGKVLVQYYEFGAGRDLVVLTDTKTNTLYIYDKSGNLLTGNPLTSGHEVSILYSSINRRFKVYSTSGSNLESYSFKY